MSPPIIAWGVLFVLALGFEGWALTKKGKQWTLSEGVWAVTRKMAQDFPYCLTLLGFVIGVLFGHFFFCPCELR